MQVAAAYRSAGDAVTELSGKLDAIANGSNMSSSAAPSRTSCRRHRVSLRESASMTVQDIVAHIDGPTDS
ncbi:MAG: hypothetical protein ACLP50_23850 [Solirubrobacteraceae bacterium]